jgi:hypothetical protein
MNAVSSEVAGFNTLVIGPTGTGKTHALRTLIDAGITPFIIATEPGIASTLGDIPPEKLHWHYIAPAAQSWADLLDSANKINTMSYESLAKISDVNKRKYGQFMEVITTCNNFVCDRDGKEYGDVATWGTDRALVIDSLSGLNIMAMNLVVGSKPTKSMSDWMVAMDNLERFLQTMVMNTQCHFILTGHVEREQDEVTGGVQLMTSTLGRKLAPKLPRFFDDVVYTVRNGSDFKWSTAAMNVDLKARNLPISDNIPPTFKGLVEEWKRKGGKITTNLEHTPSTAA